MPEFYEDFYGLTQFAIELNEIESWSKDKLPRTDCRFRPDQRWVLAVASYLAHHVTLSLYTSREVSSFPHVSWEEAGALGLCHDRKLVNMCPCEDMG